MKGKPDNKPRNLEEREDDNLYYQEDNERVEEDFKDTAQPKPSDKEFLTALKTELKKSELKEERNNNNYVLLEYGTIDYSNNQQYEGYFYRISEEEREFNNLKSVSLSFNVR